MFLGVKHKRKYINRDFVLARSWSYDKTDEARLLVEHSNMFHLQPCIICIMLLTLLCRMFTRNENDIWYHHGHYLFRVKQIGLIRC